jgi:CcmD family protein
MRYSWGRSVLVVVLLIIGSQFTVFVEAIQPAPVEEFVPIGELPEEERLPAAPFLISAYSIVWILAFGYFWMLSRRLSAVERELVTLTKRHGDATGGTSESSF